MQRRIDELGGLMATSELHASGLRRTAIAAALDTGEIQRIRQGWYANPWLPVAESHAPRVGGQLACTSAAAALGLWDPRVDELHLAVDDHARALRSPTSYRTRLGPHAAVVHWTGRDVSGSRTAVSPLTCVRRIAACQSEEVALIVAESALHRRLITRAEREAAALEFPRRVRRTLVRPRTVPRAAPSRCSCTAWGSRGWSSGSRS